MKNRLFAAFLVSIIIVFSLSVAVMAEDALVTAIDSKVTEGTAVDAGDILIDSAGNTIVDRRSDFSEVKRDLLWVGETLTLSDANIAESAILAGKTLFINDAEVGGSLRSGSYDLQISGTKVENNITSAGYTLSVDADTSAAAVYLAGYTVSYNGESDYLGVGANSVLFNGVVHGDADISGATVTIGPDAVVEGTLTVTSATQPTIPESAKVGTFKYSKEDYGSEGVVVEDDSEVVNEAVSSGFSFARLLFKLFSLLVVTVFFCLFIRDALDSSGQMLVMKPVAMLVSGLIVMLAAPMLVLLLSMTLIGIPTAVLIVLLLVIACVFAVPFTGASLGRLIFKDMNKWLSSLIGTAVLVVLRAVPYLGGLLLFLSIVYTLGYFIQAIYGRMKANKTPAISDPVEAVSPVSETL